MAPPSVAPNPPQGGQAKKPIVIPAIPFNLHHRQTLRHRQQSQKPTQAEATAAPTSQPKVQAVESAEMDNQKAHLSRQIQQPAAPATSNGSGPSATSNAPAAISTILDKTSATSTIATVPSGHNNKPKASSTSKPSVADASAATTTTNTGNVSNKPTANGAAASSKKNHHRHYGPKSNHPAQRTPAVNPQAKSGGTHGAKSRKTAQQTNNPNTQSSKNADSKAIIPPHIGPSQPDTTQESSRLAASITEKPSTDRNINVADAPTSTIAAAASGTEAKRANVAAQDGFQPANSMRGYKGGHPHTSTNGINGVDRAESVHFPGPSQQQHPAGPPVTLAPTFNTNGSLVFGGLHESNASSPAPPLSAGHVPPPPHTTFRDIAPPPGFENMNGAGHRRMNSGPGFSGPPLMMPPMGPDRLPNTTIDGHGRQLAFAPFDGLPPGGEVYGPQTPHSFQGSASPLFPERENGPMEAGAHQHRGASPNQFPPPHPGHFAPPMMNSQMPNMDTGDNMLDYIRGQFNDLRTADCTLEFRTTRAPEQKVLIHGHKLIFFRSPVLQHLLQRAVAEKTDEKPHIVLETNDRYISPVAFYSALQRLYGHSLLPVPHPARGMDMAGTLADRFEYALSYAAAGHLLRIDPVVCRGLDVASQLINWDTIEGALSFALADAPMPDMFPGAEREMPRGSEFKYGSHTQLLMRGIADFLIHNWPRHFALDTLEAKGCGYERLPPIETNSSRKGPPIARGTRPASVNPSLRSIRFGDFGGSTQTVSPESSVLSRVLLNLPFGALRFILESMAHHSPEDRERACTEVVAEREARRTQAIKKVYAGGLSGSAHMRSWFDQGGSLDFGSPKWSALGWNEYVGRHHETGLPCLLRRWFNEPGPSSPTKA